MLDWHLCQICYPLEIKLLGDHSAKRNEETRGQKARKDFKT